MLRTFSGSGEAVAKVALLLLALFCSAAHATVEDGVAAYKRGDYALAFSEFSIAAGKDDSFSQNVLGTMYAQGQGVERNYKLALDWFFKAQALGSPEAMANLAKMYASGLGVPKNNGAALQYYRNAALAGFQPAILRMAEIYERGEFGVVPDTSMGFYWRTRLRGGQNEVSNLRTAPAKAVTTLDQPSAGWLTTTILPKPSRRDKAVRARVGNDELFEKQLFQRLENSRQRERKLFVASTDNTPAIAAYLKELRAQIKNQLAAVFSSAKADESMIVTLSILRDGSLKVIELSHASGNQKTNGRVLASLKQLKRLEPLPAETAGSADVLVVSVRLPVE